MPRIDPQQLLTCLQVLLTPKGGILSQDEVQRLANLMTKFSKKLVSKCIYVLILKNTDIHLLGSFMAEGGWSLIHVWLQDAHLNKNWPLVKEVLQLLLLTPVDVERLKQNSLPKLVKSLTKREDLPEIQQLASSLVEEWLKIVKDVTKAEAAIKEEMKLKEQAVNQEPAEQPMEIDENVTSNPITENADNTLRFKVAVKDGKQVISKIVPTGEENIVPVSNNVEVVINEKEEKKDEKKTEKSNHDRNKTKTSSSKSSSSSGSSSGSRDKDRSRSSSKDNKRSDKDRKDKHRSNGSSRHKSSSSSSSRDNKDKKDGKEKQAEKDKDTLSKIQPATLQKIGRIPKKGDDKSSSKSSSTKKPSSKDDIKKAPKEETKKSTFSVEVRKNNEEKPKTVKIYNSKMRSTGLLEEAKPPPRVPTKKPTPVLPAVIPVKRTSPFRDIIPPPEKKSRLMEAAERPGAIKLIPPKPKRIGNTGRRQHPADLV